MIVVCLVLLIVDFFIETLSMLLIIVLVLYELSQNLGDGLRVQAAV